MKILSAKQVTEITGYTTSTLWRKEKAGDFPQRIQLGPNRCGWIEDELITWLKSRPRGPLPHPESLKK